MACVGFLFAVNGGNAQKKKPCTNDQAIAAETEADELKTWQEVYRSYRKFSQCDDGTIAEGYSDSIARLLSGHWEQAKELDLLATQDKGFKKFVLVHVDELMTSSQAAMIRDNARNHCPSGAQGLCTALSSKVGAGGAKR